MDINARQEQFANAFFLAVASVAGFSASKPGVDHDSVDWTIASRLSRRPKIDVQMKSRRVDEADTEGSIRYDLPRKNYDNLILTNIYTPRILILVLVPATIENWLELSTDQMVLRRCAYWISLAGQPPTDNFSTVRVNVPRNNIFDVDALQTLMQRTNDQEQI